jgi:acyl carrier protein
MSPCAATSQITLEVRLKKIFIEILEIDGSLDTDELVYNKFPGWNSLAHMSLVAAIETEFDRIFEVDDILEMSSFSEAIRIVKKYYAGD